MRPFEYSQRAPRILAARSSQTVSQTVDEKRKVTFGAFHANKTASCLHHREPDIYCVGGAVRISKPSLPGHARLTPPDRAHPDLRRGPRRATARPAHPQHSSRESKRFPESVRAQSKDSRQVSRWSRSVPQSLVLSLAARLLGSGGSSRTRGPLETRVETRQQPGVDSLEAPKYVVALLCAALLL